MSKHWYNNGKIAKQFEETQVPVGWQLGRKIGQDLNQLEKDIILFVSKNPQCRISDVCNHLDASDRQVRRLIKKNGLWDELNHDNNMEKNKQTKLEKYGNENYNNVEKIKHTNLQRYGGTGNASSKLREKYEATMFTRYGVRHNFSSSDENLNGRKTMYENAGGKDNHYKNILEKGKQTRKNKYSDEYYSNHTQAKKTMEEKYGVKYFCTHKKCRDRLNTEETKTKRYQTMRNNNSFHSSSPEEIYYAYLLTQYSKDDIIRQYSEERYPYNCDFYIKSQDLFIELNIHPTHGDHPFNPENEADLKLLEQYKINPKNWIEREKVNIWGHRDYQKQLTALENKLNYRSIYAREFYENF